MILHNKRPPGTTVLHRALPRATWLLFACQAINLTAAVISVTIAPLVGLRLAETPAMATVPYGIQFASVALLTYPASTLMRRLGRKTGFIIGALLLIAAGCIGYLAVFRANFTALVVAHALLGAYVAFANFYRFAAVDGLSERLRPVGMSLVVAGGVIASLTGPLVSIGLQDVGGYAPFSLCYAFFIVLGLATICLIVPWATPTPAIQATATATRSRASKSAPLLVAMFAAASGYMMMNLLMVQASLVMNALCVSFRDGTFVVQAHVLAMFTPSFVTGMIIARFGVNRVLVTGFLLLLASTVCGIMNEHFALVSAELVLLGLGWNFTYIGGGALLAQHLAERDKHRIQGINDSLVAVCATIGAFAPSVLQVSIGWRNTNLACFLFSAVGCAIVWFTLRERREA